MTILELCPRLFQHQVLEQLGVPQLGEQWERLQLGSQFHQLMQQRVQGLPIEAIVAQNADLSGWFQSVEEYEGALFAQEDGLLWTDCEHVRTVEWMGHTLVGVYDYLALYAESAQILDWKTYPKPMDTRRIKASWQSRLYPFLLTETSDYEPETIEMRYWFFQGREGVEPIVPSNQPQMLCLPYSAEQRDQTAAALTLLLGQLNQWLDAYEASEEPFPQTEVRSTCERCAFVVRCGRAQDRQDVLDWDDVAEVAFSHSED